MAGCGGTEPVAPSGDHAVVGVQPAPEAEPGEGEEPRGVVGMGEAPATPCAARAQALGEELGATATVTGLPPHDQEGEALATEPCEAEETDDECLRRVERAVREGVGRQEELDLEIGGERRRVEAVVIVDGARVERTFDGVEALTSFVREQTEAGREVEVEQMFAVVDPATRVVEVRRIRTVPPGERRGRAHLMVPGDPDEVMRRLGPLARRHDLLVEEVAPLEGSTRITLECQ